MRKVRPVLSMLHVSSMLHVRIVLHVNSMVHVDNMYINLLSLSSVHSTLRAHARSML